MKLFLVMILAAALQGDAQQWYDTGCRQLDEGAYHKAAVSLEKALVQAGKDHALKGRIFRKLAYTFNASGDQVRAAQNLYEAYNAYFKAGMDEEARRVLLEYGQAFYNLQDYKKAEHVFKQTLSLAHAAADTLTEVHTLRSYAAMLLEKAPPRKKDVQAAIEMYSRVADDLYFPLSCTDMGALAYAYSVLEQKGDSRYWLHKAIETCENKADRAALRFREYQVYSRLGQPEEALRALETVMAAENRNDGAALQSAVARAREDYLKDQTALAREQLRSARLSRLALALLFLAILGSVVLYFMARKLATTCRAASGPSPGNF